MTRRAPLGGRGGGGGAAALAWLPLEGISGTADYNSAIATVTDHGSGSYTFDIENATSADGAGDGAAWVASMPTSFSDNGDQVVWLRITIDGAITPASAANAWVSVAVSNAGGNVSSASTEVLGIQAYHTGGSWYAAYVRRTVNGSGFSTVTSEIFGMFVPDGAIAAGGANAFGAITVRADADDTDSYKEIGASAGAAKLVVTAGCESSTDNGPHQVKVTIEYAIQDYPT